MGQKYNRLCMDDLPLEDIPLSEYPRMQLQRDSYLCLNGKWDLKISKSPKLPDEYNESVIVPFPIESALSGIEKELKKGEYIYYRKTFSINKQFNKDRIILHFDAVDQICEVYLNGYMVCKHEGG